MVCVYKIINNIWSQDLQIRDNIFIFLFLIRVCSIPMNNTTFWKGIAFIIFYNTILNIKKELVFVKHTVLVKRWLYVHYLGVDFTIKGKCIYYFILPFREWEGLQIEDQG